MKVSFDFDNTLSEPCIQSIAKSLVDSGHDVWVITARAIFFSEIEPIKYLTIFNKDIVKVCEEIGIDLSKVIITGGSLKHDYYINGKFDLHFDDDWEEVLEINNRGGNAVLVNPDYETIYREMQYKDNENGKD